MKLEQVILRGTRASQPLATTVPIGSLYYITDEEIIERTNGTIWQIYSGIGAVKSATFITENNETVNLPNSRRLVAGANITFDVVTPGQLAIIGSSSGINQLTGDVTAGPGSGSQATTLAAKYKTRPITIILDGSTAPITLGVKSWTPILYACTIKKVIMLADQVGSIVVDIWKDTYINYPPTIADSITAAAPPTISAAIKSENLTLVGWNTAIAKDDILMFNVVSVTDITKLTLVLEVELT